MAKTYDPGCGLLEVFPDGALTVETEGEGRIKLEINVQDLLKMVPGATLSLERSGVEIERGRGLSTKHRIGSEEYRVVVGMSVMEFNRGSIMAAWRRAQRHG